MGPTRVYVQLTGVMRMPRWCADSSGRRWRAPDRWLIMLGQCQAPPQLQSFCVLVMSPTWCNVDSVRLMQRAAAHQLACGVDVSTALLLFFVYRGNRE